VNTLLHVLINTEYFDIMKYLIEHGVDLNCKNKEGNTPLHIAACPYPRVEDLKTVKLLIENGADINAKNINGETPLHNASLLDQFKIMKYLIEKGADVNAPDINGITPLQIAAENGCFDKVNGWNAKS